MQSLTGSRPSQDDNESNDISLQRDSLERERDEEEMNVKDVYTEEEGSEEEGTEGEEVEDADSLYEGYESDQDLAATIKRSQLQSFRLDLGQSRTDNLLLRWDTKYYYI